MREVKFIGWELPQEDREMLLAMFPPRYENVVAHHVTYKLGGRFLLEVPTETSGVVIGIADDGEGVQALIVEIGGTVRRIEDGGVYHITWSLADGRQAKESNDVIATKGFRPTDERIEISLEPKMFEVEDEA